ncbi:toxin RelE [Campylobacterota bacterium]|nr:toxin RelE [Campylobacterota bacterium]
MIMEHREFVLLPEFDKQWKRLWLGDDELAQLQSMLLNDPLAGDVVQGTGGLRKMRFALGSKGKSGGARVVYVDFAAYEKIHLITAYAKSEKDNMTKAERNNLAKLVEGLENEMRGSK